MAAFGGTSAREALPTRWYDDVRGYQGARVRPQETAADTHQQKQIWRRLASLNAGQVFADILFTIEVMLICGVGVLAGAWLGESIPGLGALLLVVLPTAVVILLRRNSLYETGQLAGFLNTLVPVLRAVGWPFGAVLLGSMAAGAVGGVSSVWLLTWMMFALISVLGLRSVAGWICRRLIETGALHQSVAVMGDLAVANAACQSIRQSGDLTRVAAVFGPLGDQDETPNRPFDGDIDVLIAQALANRFDTIIVAIDEVSHDEMQTVLAKLEKVPCAVQVYFAFENQRNRASSKSQASLFDVQAKPISGWGRVLKRLLDVVLAGLGLICLAPFLLLVAIAIKLDTPGPVLFTQRRHGLNRKVFRIFKLRTMSVMEDGDDAVQAGRKDPRVTRVGAFLRKTSVDELPQLLNVLKGEMSLVGPRPHPLSLDDQYADELDIYSSRHKVKPGITGWAQIKGHRGPTDQPGLMYRRVQHDLHYINNWSFWLDLKIIAATPFLGVVHKNAV